MSIVLQIDDDATSRELVERILRRRPSVQLLAADGGRAGLRLAQEHVPNLVVSDLWLPDLTGQELLIALQADPALRHIPVVITSGDARPDRIDEVMAAGAADYLTKPYGLERFLQVVDRYTGGAEPPPGSPPGRDDPVLAPDALDQLRRLHRELAPGDPLVEDFLADADRLIAAVATGLVAGDVDEAVRAAHNLAGSTGMFAATVVSGLASELERLLVNGDSDVVQGRLGQLRQEMERAADALRREFPPT